MNNTIKWSELTSDQRNDLIHEKVMGHARKTVRHEVPSRAGGTAFISSYTTWQTGGPDTPHYTTSLDAIKPLRQHIFQHFPLLNLYIISYSYNRCYATFTLGMAAGSDQWSEGNGEHCMEEAICLAALRACNVEVEP